MNSWWDRQRERKKLGFLILNGPTCVNVVLCLLLAGVGHETDVGWCSKADSWSNLIFLNALSSLLYKYNYIFSCAESLIKKESFNQTMKINWYLLWGRVCGRWVFHYLVNRDEGILCRQTFVCLKAPCWKNNN